MSEPAKKSDVDHQVGNLTALGIIALAKMMQIEERATGSHRGLPLADAVKLYRENREEALKEWYRLEG